MGRQRLSWADFWEGLYMLMNWPLCAWKYLPMHGEFIRANERVTAMRRVEDVVSSVDGWRIGDNVFLPAMNADGTRARSTKYVISDVSNEGLSLRIVERQWTPPFLKDT